MLSTTRVPHFSPAHHLPQIFAAILSKFHPDAESDARLRRDSQQIVEYIREARFISLTAMSMSDASEMSAGSPISAGSPQGSPVAGGSKGGALVDRFKRRSMVMKRKLRAMRVGEGRGACVVVSLRTMLLVGSVGACCVVSFAHTSPPVLKAKLRVT